MDAGKNSSSGGGGGGGSQVAVPPGFRFHPTEEELLYYYLRKKVSFEAIDLDVIREVDLNKLEPWDLKEKCRIGTGNQNDVKSHIHSKPIGNEGHKDKKYPTGSRTNRATAAGFWKATGRDKPIHLTNSASTVIGMRKTLVFYTGRAPHGQKTDWIMHEYRLKNDHNENMFDPVLSHVQEDAWVVCRVFKKKIQNSRLAFHRRAQEIPYDFTTTIGGSSSVHLPLLFSHDHQSSNGFSANNHHYRDLCYNKNVMNIPLSVGGGGGGGAGAALGLIQQAERLNNNSIIGGDWTCLDKLLVPNDNNKFHFHSLSQVVEMGGNLGHKFSHFLT